MKCLLKQLKKLKEKEVFFALTAKGFASLGVGILLVLFVNWAYWHIVGWTCLTIGILFAIPVWARLLKKK